MSAPSAENDARTTLAYLEGLSARSTDGRLRDAIALVLARCGTTSTARPFRPRSRAVVDLGRSLSIAIGKAALRKHFETCPNCDAINECAVAQAHRRTLADLRTPDIPPGA